MLPALLGSEKRLQKRELQASFCAFKGRVRHVIPADLLAFVAVFGCIFALSRARARVRLSAEKAETAVSGRRMVLRIYGYVDGSIIP